MPGGHDTPKERSRKRGFEASDASGRPPSKRTAVEGGNPSQSQSPDRVRANVRALFSSYNALINRSDAPVDNDVKEAFQALLKAAQGDTTSQRLAARLVPRFIDLFPDQVEVAAGALIKLYEYYQDLEGSDKVLEEHTRRDALHGLQAVLLSATSSAAGSQAVKLILAVLFRLLPMCEAEVPSTEDPEEEEGEVAPVDSSATAAQGPWVRKVLRQALQHHPITTLAFCFGCLGASARSRNSSSSNSSSSAPSVAALQGVRLWLKEHILREATPSRESTPLDCEAAGGSGGGAGCAAAAGASNGAHTPRTGAAAAAAAAAGGGGGADKRSCVLQSVLESSPELRVWIRKEAKGLSRAPDEVKAVLQAAMQLMPVDRPPAAMRPHPGTSQQQEQQPQFQQPTPQQPPLRQQQQQHKAPNGVVPRPVNGMEPLSRSWSTPTAGRGPRGHAALGRPPDPAGPYPQPAAPICRLEPCVLLYNVPWHVTASDLQQQLQAAEAWLLDTQPPAAGSSSSSVGARACCVMKAPLDAARTYMRCHKTNRLGPQAPPLQVAFAAGLPSCSRAAAAAAGGGQSTYVWALRAVAGDAERVTDDLREAGLIPKSVSRVNHGSDPGTVLEAHSAKEAGDILAFLLKTHAAAVAAAQQQMLLKLPPPPGEPAGADGSSVDMGGKSAAAAGAASLRQQQQQHGTPPLGGPPLPGYGGGGAVRRSNSLPVGSAGGAKAGTAAADGSWRNSPGPPSSAAQGSSWGGAGQQQQQQQWGPGRVQQKQQPPWQQGASPGGDNGGGRQPWQQKPSQLKQQQQQSQQQQGRWPPGGQAGASPGQLPPFPGPPGASAAQQQLLQRQHSYAGASPSGPGSTPTHGSPAGPVPPLPLSTQQQQQLQPQGSGGGQVLWSGLLYKSAVYVGSVCCVEPPGAARHSGTAVEPVAWPEGLHINHRIAVPEALEQYAAAAPHVRAVRLLLPNETPAGNVHAIQQFVTYLTGKDRAGMVKLPGAPGCGPRSLYLIVPRTDVCQSLQVAWDGRTVMLIVVVVPQGGGGGSGGGAAAAGDPAGGYAGAPPRHLGYRQSR